MPDKVPWNVAESADIFIGCNVNNVGVVVVVVVVDFV